jgi:hypothetical protein
MFCTFFVPAGVASGFMPLGKALFNYFLVAVTLIANRLLLPPPRRGSRHGRGS